MSTIDEELIEDFIGSDDEVIDEGRRQYEHFRFEVDKGQGALRIDKYLVNVMPSVSRNRIQEAADAGGIVVNGMPVKCSYKVKPQDSISVMLDYPRVECEIVPQDLPIDIGYEDEDIIVVNKQPGLVVHPGYGNYDGTLLNAIAWHLRDNPNFDANDSSMGLVHRIDKDTSGLLLIAKTPEAKTHLGLQFYNKTTYRRYQAVVWGIVKDDEGTIRGDLGRDPNDRLRFTVFPGENALTLETVYSGELPPQKGFSWKGKTFTQLLEWLFDEEPHSPEELRGLENAQEIVSRYSGQLSVSGAPGEVILHMSLKF